MKEFVNMCLNGGLQWTSIQYGMILPTLLPIPANSQDRPRIYSNPDKNNRFPENE